MKAKYWTITGEDIWTVNELRVFEFKNLITGKVESYQSVTEITRRGLVPVTMPVIKPKEKDQTPARSARSGPKSKYKGVSKAIKSGKFRAQFWDKEKNKNKYLGTFDSELEAAAAYQEHIGCHKEARRMLNEYQEGNCGPEEPGQFPSEE